MNTKKEIKEALEQLAYEMAHPTDKEGARFKIGDHVRMKHDGATGTVVRVTGPLYDGFSYEVKRHPSRRNRPRKQNIYGFPYGGRSGSSMTPAVKKVPQSKKN